MLWNSFGSKRKTKQKTKKFFSRSFFFGFVCFWKKKKKWLFRTQKCLFTNFLPNNNNIAPSFFFFQNWEIYFDKFCKIRIFKKLKKKILGFCLFLRQKKNGGFFSKKMADLLDFFGRKQKEEANKTNIYASTSFKIQWSIMKIFWSNVQTLKSLLLTSLFYHLFLIS